MKISITLNEPLRQYATALGALLWLSGVALIAGSMVLIVHYTSLRDEYPRINEQLINLTKTLNDAAASNKLPPEQELRRMRNRVQEVNSHAIVKGIGTTRLLDWLEKNMPDNVYLVELHHRSGDGEVVLVADSSSSSEFTTFLNRLEKEPWFLDAVLNKKDASGNLNSAHMIYELRVRLK